MFDWELRDKWFLLLILLAPLVYWTAARSTSVVQFSSLAVLEGVTRSLRTRLANLPALLMSLAAVSLAIALSGPRTPEAESIVNREGIAIEMVVDRSGSMQARDLVQDDLSVDRLTVVKKVFRHFVLGDGRSGQGRTDDLIGLISFSLYADSLCPLTLDHGNLTTIAADLQIASQEEGAATAIGEGLGLAVERLRRNPARSKVVILLTDGVSNSGQIAPLQAAQLASDYDIKVHCIGVGTGGIVPFPVQNWTGQTVLRDVRVEIDEDTLRQIAEKTGGRFFRATDARALEKIYKEIDAMERTQIHEVRYLQYTEHYGLFVLAALGFIGTSAIVGGTVLRRLP